MNFQSSLAADDAAAAETQPEGRSALWAWVIRKRWIMVFVVLPTLLATGYYGLIASDQYVSESRFVIKSPNQRSTQLPSIASLIQTTGLSGGQEQTDEILDYVRSRNALADLQRRIDVRAKFRSPDADFLSRYPQFFRSDRFENLYKYYESKVSAELDSETGTAILTTRAFTPVDAYDLNVQLLELSEALVNRLNDRSHGRAIAEATGRVRIAERRVREARIALRRYRNAEGLLDPEVQATGVLEITNKLITERSLMQAQLEQIERAAPANPAIPALRSRIAAVGAQIDAQTGRAVGTPAGIASKMGGYENLLIEQEFATSTLTAANAALEQARVEAQKQQFYLERVVEPNKPDLALLPERMRRIIMVAAIAACLYLIGWMLIVGILEHAPED